ncbi:hypothetical protein PR202_ga27652 [Eleusine coracana subsp. coracana]|uniref:Fatty acyl-CoA reductase n=1 Tax=Eleusine coracana subsp. coracana TaxID=191504 RepID=A0AAV5DF29_ELECO|nr:hypothetical protein PR202_ga27652 [Eleusine coracana subsp. coracana]
MIQELDADVVVEYFRGKNILITGSTGFLGKVLVEKILRVQPDVKKLFLLVRALDDGFAKQRIQTEVTGKEIFGILKEKYGDGFEDFIPEKICPLPGDIICDNLGLDNAQLTELFKHIDIIVNGAATTNFFERYDVAFNSNVLGAKHICKFAKNCAKLKMLVHVSTAYVFGEHEGLQLEKPFLMGQTLKGGTHLDIESELKLIQQTRRELKENCSSERAEKKTMKELGLKRAREFGWPNTYVFTKAMGEMLLGHLREWLKYICLRIQQILHLANIALCGVLSRRYKELNRKYNYIMLLIELYAPYTLYKGCFDDMNTERLRMRMKKKVQDKNGACHFCFDPKSIDWGDYFYRIHIPGMIKYLTN